MCRKCSAASCAANLQIFVASHWAPNLETSGYTIVAAGCENLARALVFQYLTSKGTAPQVMRRDLLEICPLEDSSLFADLEVPADAAGVLFEYALGKAQEDNGIEPLELIYSQSSQT